MNNLFLKLYINLQHVAKNDRGQDLVEYALLLTLVSLALVTGVGSIAKAVTTVFSEVSGSLG